MADSRRLLVADGCAAVVLCALALGHVRPLEMVVFELGRAVRPGGSLVVSDFHPDAARRGWKRTFRRGAQVYEIENHPYTTDELLAAARSAGLELDQLFEPSFGEEERQIFRQAGKEQLLEVARGVPAVLIARWRRPR